MFRAVPCLLFSGRKIVFLQPLVSSLSVNGRTVCRLRALNRCMVRPFTESDDTWCCNNTIWPREDEHSTAWNMSRIIMWHIYCYRIKELCIKLVIETSLYYDARSEKHQTVFHVFQDTMAWIWGQQFLPKHCYLWVHIPTYCLLKPSCVPLCMHETVCGLLGLSPWNLVLVNWPKFFDICRVSLKYGVMNIFDMKDVLNKSWKKNGKYCMHSAFLCVNVFFEMTEQKGANSPLLHSA